MSGDAPMYYLIRDCKYLNWSGHSFTDNEECAWLGSADHLTAFRRWRPLARAKGLKVIRAPEVNTAHKLKTEA